jgi:hypothetical protein
MKMKQLKLFFVCLTFLLMSTLIFSQENNEVDEHKSVELLIHKLFDGMREGDSAKVASVFSKEVNMYTSFTDQQGQKLIRKGALAPFLTAIGTPRAEIWDEKIWNTSIEIDGGIAQVWTEYAFYVGTAFSHCGVDAFHLIKEGVEGWKIVHLMDTRRKEGCEPSIN